MQLKPIRANLNAVNHKGNELVFSYETLVAATKNGERFQTATKYSNTTTRHINEAGYKNATKIPQAELEAMFDD